jgi:hypothetical protein
MNPEVVARMKYEAFDDLQDVKIRKDLPVPGNIFTSLRSAAITGSELVNAEREAKADRWLGKKYHQTPSVAILSAKDGYQLVRTDTNIDNWHQDMAGFILPKYSARQPAQIAIRANPDVAMLVGATNFFDLRSGEMTPITKILKDW